MIDGENGFVIDSTQAEMRRVLEAIDANWARYKGLARSTTCAQQMTRPTKWRRANEQGRPACRARGGRRRKQQ